MSKSKDKYIFKKKERINASNMKSKRFHYITRTRDVISNTHTRTHTPVRKIEMLLHMYNANHNVFII